MKPLASIDCEATGANPAEDAIVSLGIVVEPEIFLQVFKPWKPIPPDIEKLIGITNEAAAATAPFKDSAHDIFERWIKPHDLLGFNLVAFDVPLLWEEFYRCGIVWDLSKHRIIDAGTIWKKLEERTLSAAVQKFLGCKHEGAHSAASDAEATADVFAAMRQRFPQLAPMSRDELAEFSQYDGHKNKLTLDGKIIRGPDGDPVYNFGKPKGVKVKDDLGFAEWIMSKSFPANTRLWLEKYLDELSSARQPSLFPQSQQLPQPEAAS